MTTAKGFYSSKGDPVVEFHMGKPGSTMFFRSFGVVDTGFSGFIQVPSFLAILLQLPHAGWTHVTFADGRKTPAQLVSVEAQYDGKTVRALATVSPSDETLVGMNFLRLFDKALVVSRHGIFLIDEASLTNIPSSSSP